MVSLWTKGAGLNYNLLFAVVWCISNWSLELAPRCSQGVTIRQREFGKPVTQWFQWYSKSQRKRNLAEVNLLSSQSFCVFTKTDMFSLRHREQTLCVGNKLPSSRATAIPLGTTEESPATRGSWWRWLPSEVRAVAWRPDPDKVD